VTQACRLCPGVRRARPDRLEDLARAVGMPISGIQAAWDSETGGVSTITRLAPRRRVTP
jgi:hypothetical protein